MNTNTDIKSLLLCTSSNRLIFLFLAIVLGWSNRPALATSAIRKELSLVSSRLQDLGWVNGQWDCQAEIEQSDRLRLPQHT